MRPFTLIQGEARPAFRRRFYLALVTTALWLITFAPAVAHGQETTPSLPSSGASDHVRIKPPDAPSLPSASPTPSQTEDSSGGVEKVTTEQEQSAASDPSDADTLPEDSAAVSAREKANRGLRWKAATEQTLLFLSIQHGYAFTQPKTRRDLHGPFFRDYFRSVGSIGKWGDGGKLFTNYVAHPMQGALLGYVWVQNDPKGKAAPFGRSKAYWRSRAKALAWSAAWSTQFELGPVSQASIGNVGLHGKQTWVDIVVTPTVGTAWLVAEDALDRYVIRRIERKTDNRFVRIVARMILNPTRSSANLLRFEKPWHHDGPPRAPAASLRR